MFYDAIVVGAGPAGATVSRLLAGTGWKVLIIEKAQLPRLKPCAGAVSLRADKYLPRDWDNAVLNTVYGGNLGWKGKNYVNARSDKPVVKIVDRSTFDLFLTIKAQDAGAKLNQNERFINFLPTQNGLLEVVTDKGNYKTKYLIGADGALSKTLRSWGIKREPSAVLEAFIETKIGNMDEVFIDVGVVNWGYAWIFPKGENTVSVGIADLKRNGKNLRKLLSEYIKNHPLLKGKEPKKLLGWFIPVSKGNLILGDENVFLVGDASGATDAVLGEGIYYSVYQAHLLAECLTKSEKPEKCYRKKVRKLKREFLFAYLTGAVAYNFQQLMFKNVKPEDLKRFFSFLGGELNFRDIFLYGIKRFLQSLLRIG
jgi:geranylgeranyl reductase family protein